MNAKMILPLLLLVGTACKKGDEAKADPAAKGTEAPAKPVSRWSVVRPDQAKGRGSEVRSSAPFATRERRLALTRAWCAITRGTRPETFSGRRVTD